MNESQYNSEEIFLTSKLNWTNYFGPIWTCINFLRLINVIQIILFSTHLIPFSFLLQTTQRIIEDHKPLVEDLNSTGHELSELCSDEDASDLKEDVDNVNAKYDGVKGAIREKLGDLDDALRSATTDVSKLVWLLHHSWFESFCVIGFFGRFIEVWKRWLLCFKSFFRFLKVGISMVD